MQRWIISAFLLVSCTACAAQHGNYTQTSNIDNVRMAEDSVRKLAALYPPASTHFQISQPAQDAYGAALIQKLRTSGYGIEENKSLGDIIEAAFAPEPLAAPPVIATAINEKDNEKIISKLPKKAKRSAKVAISDIKKKAAPAVPAITVNRSLGYIVDQVGDGMYRVTLNVDAQALSRVYVTYDHRLVSAGSWTRKE